MATPDRWAPWIEPAVGMSVATQDIAATGFVVVTGVAVTFTPHINTRVSLHATVRVLATAYAGQGLRLRITVNGTSACFAFWDAQAVNATNMVPLVGTFNLTKGTTYTIQLEAELNGAGATTYRITSKGTTSDNATNLVIVTMPNLHS